jgi:hypothetical protein
MLFVRYLWKCSSVCWFFLNVFTSFLSPLICRISWTVYNTLAFIFVFLFVLLFHLQALVFSFSAWYFNSNVVYNEYLLFCIDCDIVLIVTCKTTFVLWALLSALFYFCSLLPSICRCSSFFFFYYICHNYFNELIIRVSQ